MHIKTDTQIHGTDKEPRNKPTHIWSTNISQESQDYSMGKVINKWY